MASSPTSLADSTIGRVSPLNPSCRRTYRRNSLRLRRRRAEVRADLRRRVRQDGKRRLDGRDHSGRNPAAATHRRRERAAIASGSVLARSPTGATRPISSSRSTSRCCSSRHRLGALAPDAIILLENLWATHPNPDIRAAWEQSPRRSSPPSGYRIIEVPMEEQCLTIDENPRKGKNMFALGLLAYIYDRESREDRRADRLRVPQEIGGGLREERCADAARGRVGRRESRFPDRRSDHTRRRSRSS